MNEPIVEVTRVNLYGDYRDEGIIAHKVRLDSTAYDAWMKGREVDKEYETDEEMGFDMDPGFARVIELARKESEVDEQYSNRSK